MAIIVMGVSGCGKSSIAETLAQQLGRPWLDGDNLHTPAAKAKMHAHISLTDADRIPWLERINHVIMEDPTLIVACSALKQSYRKIIEKNTSCWFIHLALNYEDAYQRVSARKDHFFPADLLRNQYDTLEALAADEPGISVPAMESIDNICKLALDKTDTTQY